MPPLQRFWQKNPLSLRPSHKLRSPMKATVDKGRGSSAGSVRLGFRERSETEYQSRNSPDNNRD
jgi:hypothetical protein